MTLRAKSGQEFASRVEDVGEDWLTVARPLDLPIGHPLAVGAEFTTTWQAENGICGVPCRLAGVRRQGIVALWDVSVIGSPWREQRRAYVRASASGPVIIRWTAADKSTHKNFGSLVDLSEAALRFVCPDLNLTADELIGLPVEVSFTTREQDFELRAKIGRVARSPLPNDRRGPSPWQVVLLFSDPGRTADDLRQIVFDEQLRDRNGHYPRRQAKVLAHV